ncbi:MAG: SpvB/TcaC N-terminal domain-containing protein, partial [Deltaproteobacteria bacterium]|nr:SpvB/TcaC N-terminal domain-containing protein [Deltaproteobacteria bacterium]
MTALSRSPLPQFLLCAFVLLAANCGRRTDVAHSPSGAVTQAVTVAQAFPAIPGNGGEFAKAVAISGNLALVGAPGDTNPSGEYTGAAYVLERQPDQTWLVKQKLHPPASSVDGISGQRFGESVAIDGDTLFVGAPLRPEDGQPRGLVHVFERETQEGSYWVEDTTLGQTRILTPHEWSVTGSQVAPGVQWRQMGPMAVKNGESWTVTMNGTGDADLFTRRGALPMASAGAYDCRPFNGSSNEACSLLGVGEHYIGVRGDSAYSKVTIQATLPTRSVALKEDAVFGPFTVKNGQRLRAQITGTNDPDLYIHAAPTRTDPSAPTSLNALLVVGANTLNAADQVIRDRLVSLGYQVQVVDDDACTTSDADGKRIVVVSESSQSAKILNKYESVAVPVVAMEVAIWDDMGMTAGGWQQDYGDAPGTNTLSITSSSHPLAAQLSGNVVISSGASKIMWGRPSASAQIAATLPGDVTKATIFAYTTGAAMVNGVAPARRVGLFVGDPTAASFTTAGGRLFDAAVIWATRKTDALLVAATIPLSHADDVIRSRMTEHGFSTHLITGQEVQLSHTVGKKLVVISESTSSGTVDNKLTQSTTPIVSLEPALFDELGMTANTWLADFGDVSGQSTMVVTNGNHPLAGGFTGAVTMTSAPSKFIWGVPNANAVSIAHASGQNPASSVPASSALTIFGYDKGSLMFGLSAPARRVGWGAGDGTASVLTADGWKLFAAALAWAASQPADCEGNPYAAGCSSPPPAPEEPDLGVAADCVSASSSATEMCTTSKPGSYYVTVHGYSAATYDLQVFFEPGHDNITAGGSYAILGSDVSAKSGVVAIAAPNVFDNGAGYVHVLRKSHGNWKLELSQRDPSAQTTGSFGSSVAVTGNRLVVGAVGGRGRVLVFDYDGKRWSQNAKTWESADVYGTDGMGQVVAADGNRIAFGLPGAAGGRGQVKVVDWTGDGWQELDLLNPQGTASVAFGSSLSLYQGQIAVGAPVGTNPGTAYLFANVGSTEPAVYSPTNAADWADVGSAVALGPLAMLVGAPNDGVENKGVLYAIKPYQDVCAALANGSACEDGNACTTGDTCQAGACVPGSGRLTCDDGNVCTADSCTAELGCVYDTKRPEQEQTSCNITGCGAGVCAAGACAANGSDANPMCKLQPRVTCVVGLPDGGHRAIFGYTNATKPGLNLSIPVGSNDTVAFKRNVVSGGHAAEQPTWIQSGTEPIAFSVDIPPGGQAVTWALGNKVATAEPAVDGKCNQVDGPEGKSIALNGRSLLIKPDATRIAANAHLATGGPIGPLAGSGDVSSDGSYQYEIPIWVPPGTNGMQPSLALSYSSRGGNGLLGVGWSLKGFSQITRCPKTLRTAGEVRPVKYLGDDDQFCMDGNPLVRLADGTYRTQIETFSKIEQTGTGTSMSWRVSTKDGRILTFGHDNVRRRFLTPTNRVGALSSEFVPAWWLTSTRDRFGNEIAYDYSNGNGPNADEAAWTLERYPTRIRYTGPQFSREVVFKHEDRASHDVLETYVSGVRYVTTKLLTAVELRVKNENGLWSSVKEYRLHYAPNAGNGQADWSQTSGRKSITGRALIESVKECESSAAEAKCGPATTFDWESGSWNFERKELGGTLPADQALLGLSDVDEDGKPDLIIGEHTDRDLCPTIGLNVYAPITSIGNDGIRYGCQQRRPDGTFPDYQTCQEKDSGDSAVLSGTQLCDVYNQCDYDEYRYAQGSTCASNPWQTLVVATQAQWAKYSYRRNKSILQAGNLSVSLESATPLVDKYFRTGAVDEGYLPSPVVTNLDAQGTADVLVVEQEPRPEAAYLGKFDDDFINEYRINLEAWPVGSSNDSAMKLLGFVDKPSDIEAFPPASVAVGDYNGDGIPDVLFPSGYRSAFLNQDWHWSIALGGSQTSQRVKPILGDEKEQEEATLLDVNGDGTVELVTWMEDGKPTSPAFGLTLNLNKSPTFVDFNGDGLVDALDRGKVGSQDGRTIFINTGLRAIAKHHFGTAHPTAYLAPEPSIMDEGVRTGDFDMDGRSDVIMFGGGWDKGNSWTPTVLLNKGSETRTIDLANLPSGAGRVRRARRMLGKSNDKFSSAGWRQAHVADFDGDGLMDIVQVDEDGTLALYRRTGTKPDLLKSVHRGESPIVAAEVTYKAITDTSGSYIKATCEGNLSAPCNTKQQQLANTGLWLVSRLTTDSGEDEGRSSNGKRRHVYAYADARTDRASGTWLGFRIFRDIDQATGESREVEFLNGSANTNAQIPFADSRFGFTLAGKVKREEIRVPGASGTNVTRKTFDYEFKTFNEGQTGLVRTKTARTEVEDPRQVSCPGVSNVSESVVTYIQNGPGALTGEVLTETTTKAPGAGCQPSNIRRHATEVVSNTFTYHNEDQTSWIVARVKDAEKTVTVQASTTNGTETTSITNKSRIEIDPVTGMVKKSITEPDRVNERSELEYEYAAGTGLPVKVTTRAPGVADRFVVTSYDSYGFVRHTENQLGHKAESIADPATGQAVWSRDMNGAITRRYVDGFFREVRTEAPSSVLGAYLVTANDYQAGPSNQRPRQVVTSSYVRRPDGTETLLNWSMSVLDRFGRAVLAKVRNSKGQVLESEKIFDWRGWLRFESVPSVDLGSLGYAAHDYDELGRTISVTAPDGATTTTQRSELRVRVTDPDGRVQESITDSLERVWKTHAIDNAGSSVGSMTYTHDAAGRLITSTDSLGNRTVMTYDVLGRRLTLLDPDAGLVSTEYNGLGEVTSETTAAGATTTFVRDVLGRTLEEVVVETANAESGRPARTRKTTFTFDAAPNGIGKPESSVSYDGVVKAYGYDELGRPVAESTVKANEEFSVHRTFDEAGRLDVVTYPEVRGPAQEDGLPIQTRVRYAYNAFNSSLARVSDPDTDAEYWRVLDRDQQGHVTQERFGNGVVSTRKWNLQRQWMTGLKTTVDRAVGNQILQEAAYAYSDGGQLRSRFDAQAAGGALRESFHYDALNRLTLWCVNDPELNSNDCTQSRFGVRYDFTDNGNLTERRTFANGAVNTPLESISFAYPAAGALRPHAVTSRSWSAGQGAAAQFEYDDGGRQWQRPGQVLTYNHNDLPERIVGANSTTQYLYAADGGRFEKRAVLGPHLTRTTTYVGGVYEMREETGTAATEPKTHVFYISLGNTMLAQLTRKEPDPTNLEVEYFHNDHMGTVSFTTNSAAIESTI